MRFMTAAVATALLTPAVSLADIAYDNLTGREPVTWWGSDLEVAQDIRLAPGSGLALTGYSMSFANWSGGVDEGSITMSLYADDAGRPGALVVGETFDYSLEPGEGRVYTIEIDRVEAPSESLWAAWRVQGVGHAETGVLGGGLPFIGSTTNRVFMLFGGESEWRDWGAQGEHSFHFRVTTVPAPGLVGAFPLWFVARRRRRAIQSQRA